MLVYLNGGDYGGTTVVVENTDNEIVLKDSNDVTWIYGSFITLDDKIIASLIKSELPEVDRNSKEYLDLKIKNDYRISIWEKIKSERDRLKFSGVKVGEHWFHSDPDSRSQQLALFIAAISGKLPQNSIMWKTLTVTGGLFDNVEVPMTTELAVDIFTTTMSHDALFHYTSNIHRENLLLAEDPSTYEYTSNWPLSFESYQKEYLNKK
jgi:hypothetical protein